MLLQHVNVMTGQLFLCMWTVCVLTWLRNILLFFFSFFQANYNSAASTNNYADSNYYNSNLLQGSGTNAYGGNYGSYNPGFNSSPSSSAGGPANALASTVNGGGGGLAILNGSSGLNTSSPRYNTSVKSAAESLYGSHHQTASSADINAKYSVHVRASPISPTYSQFSNGVSVKNCYPTYHPGGGGTGYGGGISSSKNTSFDYVSATPASQQQHNLPNSSSTRNMMQRYNAPSQHQQSLMDNYSVYVNSAGTGSAAPATNGLTPQPPPSSSSTIALHSDSSAAKLGSLATHV